MLHHFRYKVCEAKVFIK